MDWYLNFKKRLIEGLGLRTDHAHYRGYYDREYFYRNLVQEVTADHLLQLWDKAPGESQHTTQTVIFRKIAFGLSPAEVDKMLGKSRYVFKNPGIRGHAVRFYKLSLYGHRTRVQLHFLNGRFFYARYLFRECSPSFSATLFQALSEKYLTVPQTEQKKLFFHDHEGNRLMAEQGLYLSIRYVSGEDDFARQLRQLQKEQNRKQDERSSRQEQVLRDLI
jgi:hypothetical protein